MKKIERPIATSYVDEAIFHYCRSEEEVKNAFAGVDPKNIHIYKRTIDMDTFQPLLMVTVQRENYHIGEWFKWIIPLELAVGNEIFKEFEEKGW